MGIFDSTKIPLLSKALDAYALRHKVTATNIANITTPGYRSRNVKFEEQLASAMQTGGPSTRRTHDRHIPIVGSSIGDVRPQVSEETAPADELASGMNNVDVDVEMAELAKNQIRFKFAARLLGDTFRGIQKSIRGQL